MLTYTIKRLLLAGLVTLTVSAISFGLLRLSGDVAAALAGSDATSADVEYLRRYYGLDRPLPVQYLDWLGHAVQGDFGQSLYFKQPVAGMIRERLPVTLTIGACGILFAIILGIPLGVVAALRPNSWLDRAALTLAVCGQALPSFWFALLLILLFGVMLRWLPIAGFGSWQQLVMPTIALGYHALPAIMRLTRAGMVEVLRSDYVRSAYAKGVGRPGVLFKHGLRNAIIPVVSLTAVQLGFMLGGSIVIESVFALHGIGHLAWQSISRRDLPVVQAVVLIISCSYVLITLLADLMNASLDPRIRVGGVR
ncbi:MAG: ABC transporter permease [candidate division NC10 bacterium]|nr:ABC transporter permease [candidate division NC10 bacterium]